MFTEEFWETGASFARLSDINQANSEVSIVRNWMGNTCSSAIFNHGKIPQRLKEIVLFRNKLPLQKDTGIYGEGYNMLSQYKGTIDNLILIGKYSDKEHYKMNQKEGYSTVYNLALLSPAGEDQLLMAFSSCNRFAGEFRFGEGYVEVVLDSEGLILNPGEKWELETFFVETSTDREVLLEHLAESIQKNHPMLETNGIPSGWCSWYCYGPEITELDIIANLQVIREQAPELRYIQIDDGYQPYMGDWLQPNPEFAGDIRSLCAKIREQGFEPAIWVAPFIAEAESELFRQHADWFVKDLNGNPLSSQDISFGGWRRGPWFMLDGTHPEAREYLRHVFRTIREEWDCHYFKLDANIWGALHGGYRHQTGATRIEAYRQGMEAALEGAGKDCFLLGCNAPMWPSLGLVHGMRVTDDISRNWHKISLVAEQGLNRNWQHRRLWINDPDCLVLNNSNVTLVGPDGVARITSTSDVSPDEYMFHASYILATGGMVLSGDKMEELTREQYAILKKCLLPLPSAARFPKSDVSQGTLTIGERTFYFIFNRESTELTVELPVNRSNRLVDYWTDEELKQADDAPTKVLIKAHGARVIIVYPL